MKAYSTSPIWEFAAADGRISERPLPLAGGSRGRARRGDLSLLIDLDGRASAATADQLREDVQAAYYREGARSLTAALVRAIGDLNEELYAENQRSIRSDRVYANLAAALIRDDDVYLALVGHTAAYILDRSGAERFGQGETRPGNRPVDLLGQVDAVEIGLFHRPLGDAWAVVLVTGELADLGDVARRAAGDPIGATFAAVHHAASQQKGRRPWRAVVVALPDAVDDLDLEEPPRAAAAHPAGPVGPARRGLVPGFEARDAAWLPADEPTRRARPERPLRSPTPAASFGRAATAGGRLPPGAAAPALSREPGLPRGTGAVSSGAGFSPEPTERQLPRPRPTPPTGDPAPDRREQRLTPEWVQQVARAFTADDDEPAPPPRDRPRAAPAESIRSAPAEAGNLRARLNRGAVPPPTPPAGEWRSPPNPRRSSGAEPVRRSTPSDEPWSPALPTAPGYDPAPRPGRQWARATGLLAEAPVEDDVDEDDAASPGPDLGNLLGSLGDWARLGFAVVWQNAAALPQGAAEVLASINGAAAAAPDEEDDAVAQARAVLRRNRQRQRPSLHLPRIFPLPLALWQVGLLAGMSVTLFLLGYALVLVPVRLLQGGQSYATALTDIAQAETSEHQALAQNDPLVRQQLLEQANQLGTQALADRADDPTIAATATRINGELQAASRAAQVGTPTKLLDLPTAGDQIVVHGVDGYVLDRANSRVYRFLFNSDGTAAQTSGNPVIVQANDRIGSIVVDRLTQIAWLPAGGSRGAGALVALDRAGFLVQYDPIDGLGLLALRDPKTWQNVIALAGVGGNLYALDPADGTLSWYPPQTTGFDGDVYNYFNASTPVSVGDATAIAVSDDLYLLHATGQIQRFTSGQPAPFAGPPTDLQPSHPLGLAATAHAVFLGDPQHDRIMELSRDGVYRGMLTDPADPSVLANLRDFTPSDDGKALDVLSGHAVYRLAIP